MIVQMEEDHAICTTQVTVSLDDLLNNDVDWLDSVIEEQDQADGYDFEGREYAVDDSLGDIRYEVKGVADGRIVIRGYGTRNRKNGGCIMVLGESDYSIIVDALENHRNCLIESGKAKELHALSEFLKGMEH